MAISENEYFNMINNDNSNKETINKEITKPIYDYSRNENNGKIEIKPKDEPEIKTVNEINNDIINNSLSNRDEMIEKMIIENNDLLTKNQIEIDICNKMYQLYNDNIYLRQIESFKNRKIELINRIRILNSFKE